MSKLTFEYKNVSDLIDYKNNSRTHSEEQVKKISESLEQFGFITPVVLHKDNAIMCGHGRIEAAKLLKIEKVPTIKADYLTDAQKRAFIIADNRLAELAGWDMQILKEEIIKLSDEGFEINATGFTLDDVGISIEEGDSSHDDEVPEVTSKPITKLGDLIELGNHRLLCGDCTVKTNVDQLMGGDKVQMVYTDPPYGMNLNTDYKRFAKSESAATNFNICHNVKYESVIGDGTDFTDKLITSIFDNFGYCKEIFLWGADYYSELLPDKNSGSLVVWDKRLDESKDKMFGSTFEICWSKQIHKRLIARVQWAALFGMQTDDTKKRVHPTQKPVALAEWFFERWGKDYNIVDLFLGSGSTLIACEKTKRKCYGMELDPGYCDVIIKRWHDFTENDSVKINGKTVKVSEW